MLCTEFKKLSKYINKIHVLNVQSYFSYLKQLGNSRLKKLDVAIF